MSNSKYLPRLNLTFLQFQGVSGFAVQTAPQRIRELLESIRLEPEKLPQARYAFLDADYRAAAFGLYAAGYPLLDVRDALASAALAGLRVVELRGTEEPFPVVSVTLDPRYPPGDPRHAVEKPMHPPGSKDYSLGNSGKNFWYVTAALTAGEFGLARRLAALAGEPSGARGVYCTCNEEHIACAVKNLFADQTEMALAELARVRPTKADVKSADHANVAEMIRALILSDANLFIVGLNQLLRWHDQAFRKQQYEALFLSLPSTGLSILALRRGLITRDQLDNDSPFLPLELIDLVLSHANDEVPSEFRIFELTE